MTRHAQPQTAAELGLMPGGRPASDRLVTLANWQDPPFNRWAYQHFRELVPTARVDRGTGPVTRLPRETRDLDGLRFAAAGETRRRWRPCWRRPTPTPSSSCTKGAWSSSSTSTA